MQLTGGTEAPKVGLSQAVKPGRGRRVSRKDEMARHRMAQRIGAARRRKAGVAGNQPVAGGESAVGRGEIATALPGGIGHQLSRRVDSGAIDPLQAEKTARERRLLESTYGKDFRKQIGGGRGNMRLAREALEREPDNPLVRANYEALLAQRTRLLEHARRQRGVTKAQEG